MIDGAKLYNIVRDITMLFGKDALSQSKKDGTIQEKGDIEEPELRKFERLQNLLPTELILVGIGAVFTQLSTNVFLLFLAKEPCGADAFRESVI